ncbi:MAG: HD-GYP domain-containing protein [Candidatus Hydrothermia bacterium]
MFFLETSALKIRKRAHSLKGYIKILFFTVIIPITLSLLIILLTYSVLIHRDIAEKVFKGIQQRTAFYINTSASSIKNLVTSHKNDFINFFENAYLFTEGEVKKGKSYHQLDYRRFKEKFISTFDKIFFTDINFYIIDKTGKIVWTDYPVDMGLDLSQSEEFWRDLQISLQRETIVFHPLAFEVRTGKMRTFLYKRLKNGDILEMGISINSQEFLNTLANLKNLSIFLEKIGVYNIRGVPLLPEFPPLKTRKGRSGLHTREFLSELKIEAFKPYAETLIIFTKLNFFSTFRIVIASAIVLIILCTSLLIISLIALRQTEKELKIVKHTVEILPKHRRVYIDPDLSRIEEVREILQVVNNAILVINYDEENMLKLHSELKDAFYDFSERLAMVAEGYDPETGEHIRKVKYLTRLIVDKIDLPADIKEDIINFSVLHDVGKIYIPLSILNKPGPLTPEEWELMKQHTIFAQRLLAHPRFQTALEIALYHHENYDGTGYPYGLEGEAIPLPGRILKIVDVYDALRSRRPYKESFSKDKAKEIMVKGDNRTKPEHFDPVLLKIFLEEIEKVDESLLYF